MIKSQAEGYLELRRLRLSINETFGDLTGSLIAEFDNRIRDIEHRAEVSFTSQHGNVSKRYRFMDDSKFIVDYANETVELWVSGLGYFLTYYFDEFDDYSLKPFKITLKVDKPESDGVH